ncbi:hypothetical protein G7068_15950 [Leucobacter viscericola]|uniref:Uncharacterized protein n=1 Tax=Leucobacter viscericola TaxID=2714935 RepID=A0A6G7XJD1_9MICO|nr:hypothetical protein [Leucobacter viscericola]QIK64539.1 hypothetical protein G7068_15950 [Leucobacter viscericola]
MNTNTEISQLNRDELAHDAAQELIEALFHDSETVWKLAPMFSCAQSDAMQRLIELVGPVPNESRTRAAEWRESHILNKINGHHNGPKGSPDAVHYNEKLDHELSLVVRLASGEVK